MHTSPEPEPIDWKGADGRRLEALRTRFLAGLPVEDYWNDERSLVLYDRIFAQRIRWKWEWALAQAQSGLQRALAAVAEPGRRRVIDFGSGTAMASRAFWERFPPAAGDRLWLVDRSRLASRYGARQLKAELGSRAGDLEVIATDTAPAQAGGLWLVSHVLGELPPQAFEDLAGQLAQASSVLIVEPGTPQDSQRVVALRERLQPRLAALYPCPNQGTCPLSQPGASANQWCHLFAPAAAEAFTTPLWREAQSRLGIDLRSLPLSALFLGPAQAAGEAAHGQPEDSVASKPLRLLGRPKLEKGRMLVDLCGGGQVQRARLLDRDDRELTKSLRSGTPQHPLLLGRIEQERLHLESGAD
jgi:ribosomal protein RSM22 (predicted rRNA methylase)